MREIFAIDTISVSDLGKKIVAEAQDQLHTAPYNLDALESGLNSVIQQLPMLIVNGTSFGTSHINGVQQFVNDFVSNYSQLLNQRIVIGEILQGKVAPAAEEVELQIKDSFADPLPIEPHPPLPR
jgi:hypothetical protein